MIAFKQNWHPLAVSDSVISNDLLLTAFTPHQLVLGPNCSGKTTFIKQIGVACVLAQLGCFVPAQYGHVPIFESLAMCGGEEESIESGLSSFAREVRCIRDVFDGLSGCSLLLCDEFGKSTSLECALSLHWSLLEFCSTRPALFSLFSTHFMPLASIRNCYTTVKTSFMKTAFDPSNAPRFLCSIAVYKNVLVSNSQDAVAKEFKDEMDRHYGIIAARLCGLPESLVSQAEAIVPSIRVKTLRCDDQDGVQRVLLRQEVMQRLTPLVSYSSLKGDGLKSYLETLKNKYK
ncbi:uncharacterized protein [Blastocystis hominis]|uniref:DNA mismatch repair proteins mutS family domain-containing protein n=1 Tax=Blastocystis hominis TaxID=12968 RepID=D8LY07_BLAHO|nr:uncharacterized protein [Blastocystis hominis]CBK20462.2 unnamed protein product [Blastocystis hominis]|eukprot:XP_012894510.1 uncharacterized protein [Blastocystis hominis]